MDGRPAMVDGWPAGYDGSMATIHDRWMEERRERLGPGPRPLAPALSVFFHLSIMDGRHPSITAGRASIHPSWMVLDRVLE